ncbi:four-carbon acid sugar kinase family protein, partial [Paraburkholderia phenazinium]|uniref:four-carbon acid sugar kinase family protein n=1 Tax=Paraburkholderia phenazinium TaxID=60549 RepID=UPI001FCA27AE
VALKSRTIAPADAVAQSLAALDWLRAQGCRQIYFKYCSTFDSTAAGNIGPVADALAKALGADRQLAIACPAFPENGRTIYRGHLFVGDALLSESGMEHHPLTPLTDADLHVVGEACADHALVTGGSGIALGLPANFRRAGLLPERGNAAALPRVDGQAVVLAGSASRATNAQVAEWRDTQGRPAFRIDPL